MEGRTTIADCSSGRRIRSRPINPVFSVASPGCLASPTPGPENSAQWKRSTCALPGAKRPGGRIITISKSGWGQFETSVGNMPRTTYLRFLSLMTLLTHVDVRRVERTGPLAYANPSQTIRTMTSPMQPTVQAVPGIGTVMAKIYDDLVSPATKQVGRSAGAMAEAILTGC